MKNYKVSYTKYPPRDNPSKCLVIKAEDKVEAVITAYDHLTQKGNQVGSYLKFSTDEHKTLKERGTNFEPYHKVGTIILLAVEDYTVAPRGKVVEG